MSNDYMLNEWYVHLVPRMQKLLESFHEDSRKALKEVEFG